MADSWKVVPAKASTSSSFPDTGRETPKLAAPFSSLATMEDMLTPRTITGQGHESPMLILDESRLPLVLGQEPALLEIK